MDNARHPDAAPTSPKSDRVRWVRALDRRALRVERDRFRVEGPQAVREALADSLEVIYLTDEAAERHPDIATHPKAVRVPASVIGAMAETTAPQGVVAIAPLPHHALNRISSPTLIAIAVGVRDPGNLGTMIRTADAMGADLFIAANSCVDPFAPKVVRSAVGSHWHLPVISDIDVETAVSWARQSGLAILAADGSSGKTIDDIDLTVPTAWLLGNEAWGLSQEILGLTDSAVGVPMFGRAESLNVAVAASILLFASATAQRRGH